MKKLLLKFLSLAMCLSVITVSSSSVNAAGNVTVTEENNTVVIGNDYLSRTLSTSGVLETLLINNKRADTTFVPAEGSEEFIIKFAKENTPAIQLPALDRTGWTATADSYHNAQGDSDGPASNLLNGNTSSIWHTNYGGGTGQQNFPYNVIFTLNGEKTFKSFSYTPRQNGEDTNGNILGYELYASTEANKLEVNSDKWELISSGKFEYNGVNPIYVNLAEECTATQLKFVATSAKNGKTFAGGAEFNLHAEAAPVETNTRSFASSDLEIESYKVEDTTATINDVAKTGKKVTFTLKPYTYKESTFNINVVYVMYDGDHFMRKYIEIDSSKKDLAIDYIDLESLNVNEGDATWTIPTDKGGVVQMDRFKANLGQPIYIQGMFLGCEFPAADTEIAEGTGYSRYYTGKTFERLGLDNQLTTDGKYVTWQTVLGAARSTENQVIQSDFFEYIYSIATPSEFRTQYNSWFDNMMRIDDDNILESFIEVDRELNRVETRPLDSYVVDDGWNNYNNTSVVDAVRAGTTLNTTGFWEFNTKFPNKLTPSSELVQNFGSNFGVWIGPRGGYNFQNHIADILTRSGKGSKAGGSIDVADREYVKNFKDMAIEWQQEYGVNYWKWDGFADQAQYNAFTATDGVPGYSTSNRHMTGGYSHMYHVTDLWEAWIDLMEACRADAKTRGVTDLWISLTCYVNPSPWFLQWANSVWMQCTYDQKDAGFGTTKMNKQLTYRDAMYYDFYVNHQFQFPAANLYNHDPIYGKEDTGMNVNTATDEDFKNYLYMQSTRGTAFWELYYSDSIMTDGKYEVTGEFLAWAEENHHMLKNSKMIGGQPDNTKLENGNSSEASAEAYGFSCFDGKDGIISLRNPSATQAKTITFTFDRTIGVAEDAKTLKYHLEHTYNLTAGTASTGTLTYGETYTVTLQPNEVRMLRVSEKGDTTAPKLVRAFTDGAKTITVKTNEKTTGDLFKVTDLTGNTLAISSIEKSADCLTYFITLRDEVETGTTLTVQFVDGEDLNGNVVRNKLTCVHNQNNIVPETGLNSDNGFTVTATAEGSSKVLVKQGTSYELGVNAEGKAYFTLNGTTAVSKETVKAGDVITGVKENNGILKLYVDGTLAGSAYNAENRYYMVNAKTIEKVSTAKVYDIAYGYDVVEQMAEEVPTETTSAPIELTADMLTASSIDNTETGKDKSLSNLLDGNNKTFWATHPQEETSLDTTWLQVNFGKVGKIDSVEIDSRYDDTAGFNCTGNLNNFTVSVSTDGTDWEEVATGDVANGKGKVTFDAVEAQYVKITSTSSYHWQQGQSGQPDNRNKVMCIADIKITGVLTETEEPDNEEPLVIENLASGVIGSAFWVEDDTACPVNNDRPVAMATDGTKNTSNYCDFGSEKDQGGDKGSYFQLDLGEIVKVQNINLWRYWDGRTYHNTVIAIAKDKADFKNGKATIIYNTDTGNVQGLGAGNDEGYSETQDGKSWTLDELTEARYVRVYMHGTSSGGTTNHIIELEVMGARIPQTEISGLDYSVLIDALSKVIDTVIYTDASVADLEALLAEGKELLNNASTQEEINALVQSIETATANLEKVDEVYSNNNTAVKTYVFEGYYGDKTINNPLKSVEINGEYYSRYVTPEVLTVKAQYKVEGEVINARFISSVASSSPDSVKFKVELLNSDATAVNKSSEVVTKKAYKSIIADGKEFLPTEISSVSKYCFAMKLNNIPNNTDVVIKVTPYWLPHGETTYVEGTSRMFEVENGKLVDYKAN